MIHTARKGPIWAPFRTDWYLPALAIALEVCWINSWLLWISTWNRSFGANAPLSLPSTVLVLAISYVAGAYTGRHQSRSLVKLGVLSAILAGILLLVRLEHSGGYAIWDLDWAPYARARMAPLIVGVFLGLYLLWRGTSLGREPITFERYQTIFTVGLGGLVILLVLGSIGAASGALQKPPGVLGALVVLFFFAGLSGLAISNYQAMQAESARLGRRAEALSRRWLTMAFVIAIVIVGCGLILSSVFSSEFLIFLIGPLDMVATPLLVVVYYIVVYPLSYVAAGLVYTLRWILSIIARGKTEPWQNPLPANYRQMMSEQDGNAFLLLLLTVAKWLLLFLTIGLIVSLLVRYYLKRQAAAKQPTVEETSESLWSVEQFLEDLRAFLGSLFGIFRRRKKSVVASGGVAPGAVQALADDSRSLDVREIYKGLLWEGERWGLPKAVAETPREYAGRLGEALSRGKGEIDHITADYMGARYGGESLTPEKTSLVNRAWRRLRAALLGEPR